MRGTILKINAGGYGFVEGDEPGPNIFFHASQLGGGLEFGEPLIERRVEFDLIAADRGPRAINVRPAA